MRQRRIIAAFDEYPLAADTNDTGRGKIARQGWRCLSIAPRAACARFVRA